MPEKPTGVLGSAIAVNHCADGLAAQSGHVQGVSNQFGAQMISDRPPHDPAGVDIENDRGVHPALTGAVLGDVGDPQSVRPVSTELTVDQIRPGCLSRSVTAPTPTMNALETNEFHAPPHPLVTDRNPVAMP